MALNFRIVSPNGRLDIGLALGKTVYGVARQPLKFNLLTQNQATLGELGRADIPLTITGELISVSSDGQPLNGRALRSLVQHALEEGFWNCAGDRAKLPGYTRSLGSLDGSSPSGQAETTLVLGYRADPTGWASDYTKFPNLNAAMAVGDTSLSLLNATRAPTWVDGNATDRSFANIRTTAGSPIITANIVSPYLAPFTQLDELAASLITGANIPGGTTIASVQSPTQATMSQNATGSGTVTANVSGGLMLIEDELIAFRTVSRATDAATAVATLTRGAGGTKPAAHPAGSQVFFIIPWEVYGLCTSFSMDWDSNNADDVDGNNVYGFTLNFTRGNVVITAS